MHSSRRIVAGFSHRLVVACLAGGLLVVAAGCETNATLREKGASAAFHGDDAAAHGYYHRAAVRRPTDWQAQYELGRTLNRLDRPVEAQAALEQALTLRPRHPETPDILDALAEALHKQDRPEHLHAFLADTAATYGTSRDYTRQGRYLAMSGDPDGAIVAFQKAAYFAEPGDARPYIAMADFYEELGDVPNTVLYLRYAYYVDRANPRLPDRFRRHGLVPGPTLALEPPKVEQVPRGLIPVQLP